MVGRIKLAARTPAIPLAFQCTASQKMSVYGDCGLNSSGVIGPTSNHRNTLLSVPHISSRLASSTGVRGEGQGSGSGDHYLDWGAVSHRLFSQAPSKEKRGKEKGTQYKTKQRDEMM